MQDLTLDSIIALLSADGIGSKQIVLSKLKNANLKELYTLRRSISDRINEMVLDETRKY